MASIEIIMRDDEGNIISQKTQKRYGLSMNGDKLSSIEDAVEEFKRSSLPDITYDLLSTMQKNQTEYIKKRASEV